MKPEDLRIGQILKSRTESFSVVVCRLPLGSVQLVVCQGESDSMENATVYTFSRSVTCSLFKPFDE